MQQVKVVGRKNAEKKVLQDQGSTRRKSGYQFPWKLVGSVWCGGVGSKYEFMGKENEGEGDARELGNNLVCGDEPVVAATALSQPLTIYHGTEASKGKHVKMSFLDMEAKTKRIGFSSDGDGVSSPGADI